MQDQKQLWNSSHLGGSIVYHSTKPTDFVEEVLKVIKPNSNVLELGCGVGIAFAEAGHSIIATDFSEIAIQKDSERFGINPSLSFEILDMSQPFRFEDKIFDVVYARLSLHYFTDNTTRDLLKDIYRVLKPKGYLCFLCKSTNDPLYGKGTEIEKDMFEYKGHVRHFFSEEYASSLLKENFEIIKLESGDEKFYGSDSAFVKVIAQAK